MDIQKLEQELNQRFKEFLYTSSEFKAFLKEVRDSLKSTEMNLLGFVVLEGEEDVILEPEKYSKPQEYNVLGDK